MTAQILKFPKPGDKRKARRRHPLLGLPFVRDGWITFKGKRTRERCFWHVTPSGDYAVDLETGHEFAEAYLNFRDCRPPSLGWIVGDMPRELTGLEIGFLGLVGRAASPDRARQIRNYEAHLLAEFIAREQPEPLVP